MTRILLALALTACGSDPVGVVESSDGERRLRVHVEVARTATERMRGLRGMDTLASDEGVWIEFPIEGEVCIVNDGVPFPIDAIFIREDARVSVVETYEANEAPARCHVAHDVLEVPAGVATSVQPGDLATLR